MQNGANPIFSENTVLSISLSDKQDAWKKLSISLENCSVDQFFSAATAVALAKISLPTRIKMFGASDIIWNNIRDEPPVGEYTEKTIIEDAEKGQREVNMNDFSRDELNAHLKANKAEVDAVAASMRQEMAEFRAFQAQQFSAITTSLSEIKGEMSSAKGEMAGFKEGMSGQISGLKDGLSGQIDGVKSSISTMQWMIGTVLAMIGIVAAILAIPGLDKII